MIIISNGKITVPENEAFIGFEGDNLHTTREFLITDEVKQDAVYRFYLMFDDGTCNYFMPEQQLTPQGTVLVWNITGGHIFKSGVITLQIKAFYGDEQVYHTAPTKLIAGKSIEFAECFKNSENSEFLEYEKKLNEIRDFIVSNKTLLPYIGSNGNWYVYDGEQGIFADSGISAKGEKGDTGEVADGSITVDKLAQELMSEYLYYPLKKQKLFSTEPDYDALTEQGMYYIDTHTGMHNVVCVLRSDNNLYTMQLKFQNGNDGKGAIIPKLMFRACVDSGVWTPWQRICKDSDSQLSARRRICFKKRCGNWSQPRIYLFNSVYARRLSIEAWAWDNSPTMDYDIQSDTYYAEIPNGFENCIFFCDNQDADGNKYQTNDLTIPPETLYSDLVYFQSGIGYDGIWADRNTESWRLLIQYYTGTGNTLPTVMCDGKQVVVSRYGIRTQMHEQKPYAITEIPIGTNSILIDFGDGNASTFNTENLCYNLPAVIYDDNTGSFSVYPTFDALSDEWLSRNLFINKDNIKLAKELWNLKDEAAYFATRQEVNNAISAAVTEALDGDY